MTYTYRLQGSEIARALNGVGRRTVALFLSEQDNASNPDITYQRAFYDAARPRRGVIGWGTTGCIDGTVTAGDAIVATEIDLTNVTRGTVQLPFDRTIGAWDADLHAKFFDTSANAFTGTTLGVMGDFIFGYATEFGFDASTPVADGQALFNFQPQARDSGGPLDEWMTHQITARFFCGLAGEDATGVNPIVGPSLLQLGVARDLATPTINGGVINAGTAHTLVSAAATIPAGGAGTLPALSIHSQPTFEFDNLGTRFVAAGCFMASATAREGLAVMFVVNPLTNSFDFGTGPPFKMIADQVYTALHAAIGFNALIIRTAGWFGASFESGNDQPDQVSNLSDLTEPKVGGVGGALYNTTPWGDYRNDFIESEDDRQRNIHTDIGIDLDANPSLAMPTLFLMSHWAGAGTTLAQARLIRGSARRGFEWGLAQPLVTPNHPAPTQVWLFNGAVLDVWDDVTIEEMLTGQGERKYVRANGSRIHPSGETWAAGRAYLAGDVVCDASAGRPLRCDGGWHYCTASHTSAASGSNGPPSDGASTRWARCDLRLNDNGRRFECARIWRALRRALNDDLIEDGEPRGGSRAAP